MIYFELFLAFLEIGAFTFGGGYAMLPLIRKQVIAHDWMSEQALVDFIAVSESTPGPFAINIATYVGSQVGGVFGAVCTTFGVVLPSFLIILFLAGCYQKFKDSKIVKGLMSGLKPAVVGLIGAAALSIAQTVFLPDGFYAGMFSNTALYCSLLIFNCAGILTIKKLHPIAIICLSGLLGIISGYAIGL